ncbi:LicD family protein [Pontibacter liquoris]|uniref:LicD family protein n=1 Tax=Pontibacter liquoris TaxID=2905677 RepID=UPI001FA8148E|nr:LicD family protein [Pontibacter liquoris]
MEFDSIFPDNREEGDTLIKQCQLVMLRMLKILDYLCSRHQIAYFLVGGSLLGAIRHQGFIPWDDDLDVGMTRENYEKFLKYAVPELPEDIFFQSDETDPGYRYKDMVEARLRDKYSCYTRKHNRIHEGLQVDIFVYDRAFLPHNYLIILQNFMLGILGNHQKRANVLKNIAQHTPLSLVYASSYLQSLGMWNFGSNFIKAEELATLDRTMFEDMQAAIPIGWDNCLKRQYGNYMQLPPIEKQKGHHTLSDMPAPFTPCQHTEILFWKNRKLTDETKIKKEQL